MGNFTFEEMNLMCIYNTGSRTGLIDSLREQRALAADEQIMVAQPEFVNEIGFRCDFADDRMTNAHMQYPS